MKQKKSKNYSVLIVSDALTSSKEFVISKKFIKSVLAAVLTLILLFGVVIFDYLNKYVNISSDNKKNALLSEEKKENLQQIKILNENLKEHKIKFIKMKDMVAKFMIITGLNSPYSIETGMGGPDSSQGSNVNKLIIKNDNLKMITDSMDFDKINTDSIKTEKDLDFILNVIKKKKTQLAATPSIWPCKGYLTNVFGYRIHPFTGKREFHYGIDISSPIGSDVVATGGGYILSAKNMGNIGKMIVIAHGFGYTTRYGHLVDFNVKQGDSVTRGQIIGYVGNTGRSTAPHLHYEVRYFDKKYNPMDFVID